ncbi:hypothetical protein [Hansschlegelia beijingensis]|uniref:hypothetical protein n=1 Tax=Hansschlegelia beijingensis TaxID=1133344 RepID=UPI003890EE1A
MLEQRVAADDVGALAALLGPEAGGDPDLWWTHWLDQSELERLIAAFGVSPTFREYDAVALARPSSIRNAPYLVHTGFELFLMLEGRKPFAAFDNEHPSDWAEDYLAPFEREVAAGRLSRRSAYQPFPAPVPNPDGAPWSGVQRTCDAAPGEEWRFDAYDAMLARLKSEGWSAELERLQGTLLGYEDWQNNWWAAHAESLWERAALPHDESD